jgi:hypothetical protein
LHGFVDRHRRTSLSEGYAAVFATVLIWSTPSLFMYYLNRYYDPWAQNFYRYFVRLSRYCTARVLSGPPRRAGDRPARRWALSSTLRAERRPSSTQVMALFYMGPGVYTIFIRSSVIFHRAARARIFSRGTLRHSAMEIQAGTLLGLIGAFGVIWFQPNMQSQERHIALPGLLIAFAGLVLLGALRRSDSSAHRLS